jgi:FixJ family two-component response regulator
VLVENRDLTTALAKLPPKQAATIVLRHYHGYTNRTIAQALGIPERTVASRLGVAKARLRVMLKDSYGPEAKQTAQSSPLMGSVERNSSRFMGRWREAPEGPTTV